MEPEGTDESDTDKAIIKTTEIKHVTKQKSYFVMTIETDGTKKNFNVNTGAPGTIIPRDKEVIEDNRMLPLTKKVTGCFKERSYIRHKGYGKSRE